METIHQANGWNGCDIAPGMTVKIMRSNFGRACLASVVSVSPLGDASVVIQKIGRTRAGWAKGNRVEVNAAWLSAE